MTHARAGVARAARRPGRRAARPAPLAAALVTAAGLCAWAAWLLLRHRVALVVLLGRVPFGVLVILEGLGVACALVALARLARASDAPRVSARLLAYLLVAGALAHALAAPSFRSLYAWVLLGGCAAAFAALALAAPRLAPRLAPRTWSLLDLLAFCACALLIGGELLLQTLAALRPSPLFAHDGASVARTIDEHRLDPSGARPHFPVNAGGHHDHAFDADAARRPLVVAIGDSFSAGIVPHPYHFTTVAERHLEAGEVYNMGVAAIGLREYLHLLHEEALPLRPDLVVVDVFVGNDLVGELGEAEPLSWLQRGLDGEHLLVTLVPSRLLALAREAPADARAPAKGRRAVPGVPLEEQFPWLEDPLLEVPSFSPGTYTRMERMRAASVCDPHAPPDWDGVFALLEAMAAACGEVPFAVMLIPDEFQVEDAVWRDVVADPSLADLERDQPQRVLVAGLAERGIPVLDLLPVLRAQAPLEDGRLHLYHLRESHFNARGNAVTGRALAAFVEEVLDEEPAR